MNKKMAFVLPTTLGNSGGIKVVFSYAEEFNKLGYSCDVIYPLIPSNYKLYKLKSLKNIIKYIGTLALNLFNYNYKKFKSRYKSVYIVKVKTLKQLKNMDYEIYIATAWDTYYYINKTNSIKKYLVQSYETWSGPSTYVERTYEDNNCEYYCISKNLQDTLYEKFNTNSKCIYNPIGNTLNFDIKKTYESNTYGVIYRREKNKNFKLIEKFLKENIEYRERFYCLGRNIPKKYKKLFSKCYDGTYSQEVDKFYKDINVFIMPSNHEGFSLPIMEAISYKNLLISNNTGVLMDFKTKIDYISIGKNMNNVKYKDLEEAIYCFEKIEIEEKEQIIKKNYNFYKQYIENVDWEKNCKKILNIYK